MRDVMIYAIYMAAFIAGGCTAFAIMNEGRGWKRMIIAWLAGNLVTAVVVPLFLFTLFAYLLIDVSIADPDVGDAVVLSWGGPIIGILMAAFLNRRLKTDSIGDVKKSPRAVSAWQDEIDSGGNP
jgi:hypothetical protein